MSYPVNLTSFMIYDRSLWTLCLQLETLFKTQQGSEGGGLGRIYPFGSINTSLG